MLLATPAGGTYSIVGADRETREVGGSGTSCLDGSDVYIIYGAVPGVGVVHAQARYTVAGRERAVQLLSQGMAPDAILTAITHSSFDSNARERQYGIVDAEGRAAAFTGQGAMAFAGHETKTRGALAYAVQGNILTSEAVLTRAAAAFETTGCDLAERLMLALEAGADGGEGDSRCTPDGIPSDSAFLQVERPNAALGSTLSLRVRSSGSASPLIQLRAAFDQWRLTHPCPTPSGSSGSASGTQAEVAEASSCGCRAPGTTSNRFWSSFFAVAIALATLSFRSLRRTSRVGF